ncbi:MAG: hypothetical protein GOV15_01645 [Candidatus Diapherotrites archaeon]|nr:hypothetical protein [Candidatus Diapherotrites archaeon]
MGSSDIVSDFRVLESKFPKIANDDSKSGKGWAVKTYLSHGGIVKLTDGGSLTYPSKSKLESQAVIWKKKRDEANTELQRWVTRYNRAKNELVFLNLRKVTIPEYWKHVVKYRTDREYRDDFDRAGMRTELAAHEKWGAMFAMFVENLDYRKRLVETVENSVVYARDKTLAKNLAVLRDFVMSMSSKKQEIYKEKVEYIEDYLTALNILNSWSSRRV